MKANNTTLSAAVILAMGAHAGAQANMNDAGSPGIDIDIASGILIDEGMSLSDADMTAEHKIILAAKKAAPKRKAATKR